MVEKIKFWAALFILYPLLGITNLSLATEDIIFQNWTAKLSESVNEAYTAVDEKNSFGIFCGGDQCLYYLHINLNCILGEKYSVLMNGQSISTALSMECTKIRGNLFQILMPFNAVQQAIQVGDSIDFAVALQGGGFVVTKFSLLGAQLAIGRVLSKAAKNELGTANALYPKVPNRKLMPNIDRL